MGIKPLRETGAADPIVTLIAQEDHVSWIRKKNLRTLYLLLFPACMGIELTSGFDSQLINALQIVPSWIHCTYTLIAPLCHGPLHLEFVLTFF